jgi:hypothetical protein
MSRYDGAVVSAFCLQRAAGPYRSATSGHDPFRPVAPLMYPNLRAAPAGRAEVPFWRQTIICAVYPRSRRAPAPIYVRANDDQGG